jgi:hypothetical protein
MTDAELDARMMEIRGRFLALLTEHSPQDTATRDMLINAFDTALVTGLQAQQDWYAAHLVALVEKIDMLDAQVRRFTGIGGSGAGTPDPALPAPDRAGD